MNFFVYKDRRGEWRWRLKSSNGRIVADSGEGYKRSKSAQAAISRIKFLAPTAKITVIR